MRCFTHVLALSLSVSVTALLGVPSANGADNGRNESAKSSKGVNAASVDSSFQKTIAQPYQDLPLRFEANQGQTDGQVRFLSNGSGYSFFLTQSGAVLTFARDAKSQGTVLRMELAGANQNARIHGVDQLPGNSNYFFGNDAQQWRTGVPTYAKVGYDDVYPGIDLVYYGNQRQLEYDFVIAAGADPEQIRLAVSGTQSLTRDA